MKSGVALALGFALGLAACGSTGTGGPPAPAPSNGTAVSPAASPSAAASPAPAPSPSPQAAGWSLRGGTGSWASIVDIRTGTHPGYDRLVIEFDTAIPTFEMVPNPDGTRFALDPKGGQVTVAGAFGATLRIDHLNWTTDRFAHGRDLIPGYAVLKEARVTEEFEGVGKVAIGLSGDITPTVTTLSSPPRLVIDFPHP